MSRETILPCDGDPDGAATAPANPKGRSEAQDRSGADFCAKRMRSSPRGAPSGAGKNPGRDGFVRGAAPSQGHAKPKGDVAPPRWRPSGIAVTRVTDGRFKGQRAAGRTAQSPSPGGTASARDRVAGRCDRARSARQTRWQTDALPRSLPESDTNPGPAPGQDSKLAYGSALDRNPAPGRVPDRRWRAAP